MDLRLIAAPVPATETALFKFEQVAHFVCEWNLVPNDVHRIGKSQLALEQQLASLVQGQSRLGRDADAPQTHCVDIVDFLIDAHYQHEWRHVSRDFGHSTDHRNFADTTPLVDA